MLLLQDLSKYLSTTLEEDEEGVDMPQGRGQRHHSQPAPSEETEDPWCRLLWGVGPTEGQ